MSGTRLIRYSMLVFVKGAKALKALKSLAVVASIGSSMLSILAYSFLRGVWFSVGFVAMLFIHEMGHVVALKRKGMKASVPVFIPFLGALIFMPKPKNRDVEAYVGYGGPLVGGAAAILMLAYVWLFDPGETVTLIVFFAFLLNLFNLVPIRPFDGGRVTQAVGPWFKYVAVAILIVGTIALRDPSLLIIWLFVIGDFPLRRPVRIAIALTVWTAMTVMLLLNVGDYQPWWWDLIDMILGAFLVLMCAAPSDEVFEDKMPQLARNRKLFWLGLYIILAVVLAVGLFVSATHVPDAAKP